MMNAPLSITMPAEASAAPKAYKLLIDGKQVDARDGRTIERKSAPATASPCRATRRRARRRSRPRFRPRTAPSRPVPGRA